ncbi:MAG TPA: hydrogenase maturation protease [Pyrodictium sp.]|nr:hydrogenase maturation protease [Pyrodictium sp.]
MILKCNSVRTLVFGVGNRLRGDDGFGSCFAEALERCGIECCDVIVVETMHVYAIDYVKGYDVIIILDVVLDNAPPGTILVEEIDPSNVRDSELVDEFKTVTAHYFGPHHLIVLAYKLGYFNGRAYLLGIVPANLHPQQHVISTTLRNSLPRYYEAFHELASKFGCKVPPLSCIEEVFERVCIV